MLGIELMMPDDGYPVLGPISEEGLARVSTRRNRIARGDALILPMNSLVSFNHAMMINYGRGGGTEVWFGEEH